MYISEGNLLSNIKEYCNKVSPIIGMLCTIWYAFKKLSLRQSLCSMISIFASKLLGVVSVILSSNSSSKSKVSTLVELCVPYIHLGFL